MRLPEPGTVLADARRAGERTKREGLGRDESAPNIVVATDERDPRVERTDEGYAGEDAPEIGLLAAGLEAIRDATDVALHYPDPDLTARGPWLVLCPLSGFISTVHTGTARATVEVAYDRAPDTALDGVAEHVDEVLAAACPSHDSYPVADYERGVFGTGMTTYTPTEITTAAGSLIVEFDVSTTPSTTPSGVSATFADVDGLVDVRYEAGVGVERAAPSERLRSAVEAAHRTVFGDAEYEWVPEPSVFSRIPGGEKIGFGTGVRGDDGFGDGSYATCVDLLAECLANLEETG